VEVKEALVYAAQLLHVQGSVVHPPQAAGFFIAIEAKVPQRREEVGVGQVGALQALGL